MYLYNDLKPQILLNDRVECPIMGCTHKVDRQTKIMEQQERFRCPYHDIYISPSTFEYCDPSRNLLWNVPGDERYLQQVLADKTESRMARERSEDALTWNVFRYLQKHRHLTRFVHAFTGFRASDPELIFWSYAPLESGRWEQLIRARKAFGEREGYGSEPDLIIDSEDSLLFIEVKFTSGNNTVGSSETALNRYARNEDHWFEKVFSSKVNHLAVDAKKYELMRFWLLGTWLAEQMGKNFVLISLTAINRDRDLKAQFKPLIRETHKREFRHIYWEEVRNFIYQNTQSTDDKDKVIRYLEGKSVGYVNGKLKKGFRY